MKFVYRNYWDKGHKHNPYTDILHNSKDKDAGRYVDIFKSLWHEDLKDGDEVEITVMKTGNRPFGNRRIILQEPHIYGPETDEQMKERLDNTENIPG